MVPVTSDEFKSIATSFQQAMTGQCTQIIQIDRIQNERWYSQYLAHSCDFRKRDSKDTEKRLYHGCPETAVNLIIEDCFNRSFAGKNGEFHFFNFQISVLFILFFYRDCVRCRCLFFIKSCVQSWIYFNESEWRTTYVCSTCAGRENN